MTRSPSNHQRHPPGQCRGGRTRPIPPPLLASVSGRSLLSCFYFDFSSGHLFLGTPGQAAAFPGVRLALAHLRASAVTQDSPISPSPWQLPVFFILHGFPSLSISREQNQRTVFVSLSLNITCRDSSALWPVPERHSCLCSITFHCIDGPRPVCPSLVGGHSGCSASDPDGCCHSEHGHPPTNGNAGREATPYPAF